MLETFASKQKLKNGTWLPGSVPKRSVNVMS